MLHILPINQLFLFCFSAPHHQKQIPPTDLYYYISTSYDSIALQQAIASKSHQCLLDYSNRHSQQCRLLCFCLCLANLLNLRAAEDSNEVNQNRQLHTEVKDSSFIIYLSNMLCAYIVDSFSQNMTVGLSSGTSFYVNMDMSQILNFTCRRLHGVVT